MRPPLQVSRGLTKEQHVMHCVLAGKRLDANQLERARWQVQAGAEVCLLMVRMLLWHDGI